MNGGPELTLYSFWRSSASYRVRIALELKGIRYRLSPVHLTRSGGDQYADRYRALNPESRVPLLLVDDRPLVQSVAIMEWLEDTYPEPPLLPRAAPGRAHVRALVQLLVSDMQPLQNLSVRRYLHERLGVSDAEVAGWIEHWMVRGFRALEQHLARGVDGAYCHGDAPTLADACLVPQCYAAELFGVSLAPFPHVRGVLAACRTHPAFLRAAPEAQPDAEISPDAR